MRLGPRLFAIIVALCACGLFVSSVVFVRTLTQGARLDLSQARSGTLSPPSQQVLQRLGEPVRLTLYRSIEGMESRPDLRAFAERTAALLDAYKAAAPERIVLEQREPVRFSAAEDEAIRLGLKPLAESWSVQPIYLGLVARNALDEAQSWPALSPEQEGLLEQIVTSMILRLEDPDAPAPQVPTRASPEAAAAMADLEIGALQRALAVAEGKWLSAEPQAAGAARAEMLRLRRALRTAAQAQVRRRPLPPLWALLSATTLAPGLLLGLAGFFAWRRERAVGGA